MDANKQALANAKDMARKVLSEKSAKSEEKAEEPRADRTDHPEDDKISEAPALATAAVNDSGAQTEIGSRPAPKALKKMKSATFCQSVEKTGEEPDEKKPRPAPL